MLCSHHITLKNTTKDYSASGHRAATHSSTCKKGGFKTARHDAIAAVICSMYRAIGGVCEADHEYGKRAEGDAAARKKANPCTLPSNAKVDVVFYGLADGDQDLYIDVRVACAESHEVGFKEAIAAAEKIKTDKYAREVAGISQSAFLPFVVGSHGGFGTCAKQVWALLVQRAKLVAARDWRQSWSAMTYQQVWLRRCGGSQLRLQSKRRLLPLCASRLLPARLLWVWLLCSVRARSARVEVRDTRVCVSLLLETVAAEAGCRILPVPGSGGGGLLAFLFGVSCLG